jgi:hypothetical protein
MLAYSGSQIVVAIFDKICNAGKIGVMNFQYSKKKIIFII